VVTLASPMLDPRSACAAADVVIGIGSSSLRALARGKPVLVHGMRGFNAPFDRERESLFLRQGFYGEGDGTAGGLRLAGHLAALLADNSRRAVLGARGREIVVAR